MSSLRIKYLDMDECPRIAFNEMIVVGVFCAGIPFGIWWLGCILFHSLGWEAFHQGFHIVGFAVALFVSLGLICGAKTSAVAASYGAFFFDAILVALFFWIVRREFRTLWMLTALVGLAIHLVGRIPAVAALQAKRNRRKDAEGLQKTADMLCEQGADPTEVGKAVEEVRAGRGTGTQVAWFELLKKLNANNRRMDPNED